MGIGSVQLGAAAAKGLFDEVGPAGTVLLRVAFAALVLMAISRPALRGHPRGDLRLVAMFGFVLAGMNLAFYASIERIPLGVAVTCEFVGPLGVAIMGSRRALDILWAVLAGAGVALLGGGAGAIDPLGVALALLAGGFWAAYILAAARVGGRFPALGGLALAMAFGALLLVPVGVLDGGAALLDSRVLLVGLAVAMLSSAIPYTLELEALRRLPAHVFGILMSLEPGVAALVGLLVLREVLGLRDWLAIALVVGASVGASRSRRAAGAPAL